MQFLDNMRWVTLREARFWLSMMPQDPEQALLCCLPCLPRVPSATTETEPPSQHVGSQAEPGTQSSCNRGGCPFLPPCLHPATSSPHHRPHHYRPHCQHSLLVTSIPFHHCHHRCLHPHHLPTAANLLCHQLLNDPLHPWTSSVLATDHTPVARALAHSEQPPWQHQVTRLHGRALGSQGCCPLSRVPPAGASGLCQRLA